MKNCWFSAPSPLRLPIIGHLHLMRKYPKEPWKALDELAKKYGGIYELQLGQFNYVVIADLDSVRDALVKDGSFCLNRPLVSTFDIFMGSQQNSESISDFKYCFFMTVGDVNLLLKNEQYNDRYSSPLPIISTYSFHSRRPLWKLVSFTPKVTQAIDDSYAHWWLSEIRSIPANKWEKDQNFFLQLSSELRFTCWRSCWHILPHDVRLYLWNKFSRFSGKLWKEMEYILRGTHWFSWHLLQWSYHQCFPISSACRFHFSINPWIEKDSWYPMVSNFW